MANKYYENYYNGEYKYNSCEEHEEYVPDCGCNCDCDCKPYPPCPPEKKGCEFIDGNSLEIEITNEDCEVRADIQVAKRRVIRVWGQVKDCQGNSVEGALVKLLKPVYVCGKVKYTGIAHTVTDCMGFYQFDLCPMEKPTKFRILVGKAAVGLERVIESTGDCDPCAKPFCE